jgi:hypothetical protein
MCDTDYQLPGSVPVYAGTPGVAVFYGGSDCYCSACMTWVSGHHACMWPTNAGFAAYPQPMPATTGAPGFDKFAAQAALHRLADGLARLTLNMGQDEQAGVWAAYYDLQAKLQ